DGQERSDGPLAKKEPQTGGGRSRRRGRSGDGEASSPQEGPRQDQQGDARVQAADAAVRLRRKGAEAEAGRRHRAERSPPVGSPYPEAAEIPGPLRRPGRPARERRKKGVPR